MDQHRDALAAHEQQEAKLDWQADRTQLRENLGSLRNTIDRLHGMRPQYLELIKYAQLNIQDTDALEKELNSVALRFGLLPMPARTIECKAIQRQLSSTHKRLHRARNE